MTNANILLQSNPDLSAFFILFIALFGVKIYSQLDPYIEDTDDTFAEVGKWNTVAIVIFSIILQCGVIKSTTSGVGLVLVILLASVTVGFAVCCLHTIYDELIEMPRQLRAISTALGNKPTETITTESDKEQGDDTSLRLREAKGIEEPGHDGNFTCFPTPRTYYCSSPS